jgi:pimeloyl-ACP methyl ester carboxylesterase
MRADHVLCLSRIGFHRMAYVEQGDRHAAQTVVCVHGLTRNGRDFDRLSAALATTHRVVAPDIVGRGKSDWLGDPGLYGYPQYMADMATLLGRLEVESVDWVGTSMGGLIGLFLAALPRSPIRRLVLNDVGPFIPKAALEAIAGYTAQDPVFDDLASAETEMRRRYSEFGVLDDAGWAEIVRHGVRERPGGRWGLAYDPGIAEAFKVALTDVDLWPVWDRLQCPVLVLRGARSSVLPAAVAERMAARAQVVTLPDCGHAPWLADPTQIAPIVEFLQHGRPGD